MDITKIWAKTAPKKSLIDHMLETGIVTECLIDADGMYHSRHRKSASDISGA